MIDQTMRLSSKISKEFRMMVYYLSDKLFEGTMLFYIKTFIRTIQFD
jgi:hypothetical protein